MAWVLVIYVYVGVWGNTDSVALTNVPMASQEACQTAGARLGSLVSGSKKEVRYVCLKTE